MSKVREACHFVIEYTIERTNSSGATWRQNQTLDVLCSTAERALQLMRGWHPDAVVHVVRRVGTNRMILIDAEGSADE
jgi:tRNA pseudouridine-54 N-methylase